MEVCSDVNQQLLQEVSTDHRDNFMTEVSVIDSGVDVLYSQLRVVFDSCEADIDGRISLRSLANLSRSHCSESGPNLVDKLLEIFQCGEEEGGQDRVDFPQFCDKMIGYINLNLNTPLVEVEEKDEFADSYSEVNVKTVPVPAVARTETSFSPSLTDQGAFNENLKRSFQRTRSEAVLTSSPSQGQAGKPRRKLSQTRLPGNIPLVNTSSEDEAEDSFDRQIADSLSVARPVELLVRGSSLRSTLMKKQANSAQSSPSTDSRRLRMYPEDSDTDSGEDISQPTVRRMERRMEQLTETARESPHSHTVSVIQDCSLSYGTDSLRADLEEEIQTSLLLARKHGEERLESERRRHAEQVESMEREVRI